MPRSGESTRLKILAAAEEVIAERGVDLATFAEINQRAGQRNNSATQYHFGDRVSLLVGVVRSHSERISVRRAELLAAQGDDPTLREIVEALVAPLAECLDDASGRRYLSIQASLLSHPDRSTWPASLAQPWDRPGIGVIADQVRERQGGPNPDQAVAEFKREFASLLLFHALANEARRPSGAESREKCVAVLVDALVAMIGA